MASVRSVSLRVLRPGVIVALGLAAASCGGGGGGSAGSGGGGGGGGGSSQTSNDYLSIAPGSVTWSGDNTGSGTPSPTFDLTLTAGKSLSSSDHVFVEWSGGAIEDVANTGTSGASTATLHLTGWPALDLGAGRHTDTLIIKACTDENCDHPIAASTLSVPVTYNVTGNAEPGSRASWPISDYSFTLHATDPTPTVELVAHVDNIPPDGLHVMYSIGNGSLVQSLTAQYTPSSGPDSQDAHFALQLKAPSSLMAGQYNDSVQLQICFDTACAHPIANGTFTATVSYQMQATEGVDYSVSTFTASVADIAWNPSTQTIELIGYGTSSVLPSTLAELDPATNTVMRTATLTHYPSQIVVSDDGQFTYVLEGDSGYTWWLERIRTSDFTIDMSQSLGVNSSGFLSILAVPGEPHAVLLQWFDATAQTLSILDDGVARAGTLDQTAYEGANLRKYFWSDSATLLYAYQPNTGDLLTIPASAAGLGADALLDHVTLVDTSRSSGYAVAFSDGLIFGVDGHVFDPTTLTMQAPFAVDPNPYKNAILVDAAVGRAYFLMGNPVYLDSYAIAGRDHYWRLAVPTGDMPNKMIRFGTNGVAFLLNDRISMVTGQIITQ